MGTGGGTSPTSRWGAIFTWQLLGGVKSVVFNGVTQSTSTTTQGWPDANAKWTPWTVAVFCFFCFVCLFAVLSLCLTFWAFFVVVGFALCWFLLLFLRERIWSWVSGSGTRWRRGKNRSKICFMKNTILKKENVEGICKGDRVWSDSHEMAYANLTGTWIWGQSGESQTVQVRALTVSPRLCDFPGLPGCPNYS